MRVNDSRDDRDHYMGLTGLAGTRSKKVAILIEEINQQIRRGKEPFMAVMDSGISRVRLQRDVDPHSNPRKDRTFMPGGYNRDRLVEYF